MYDKMHLLIETAKSEGGRETQASDYTEKGEVSCLKEKEGY